MKRRFKDQKESGFRNRLTQSVPGHRLPFWGTVLGSPAAEEGSSLTYRSEETLTGGQEANGMGPAVRPHALLLWECMLALATLRGCHPGFCGGDPQCRQITPLPPRLFQLPVDGSHGLGSARDLSGGHLGCLAVGEPVHAVRPCLRPHLWGPGCCF